MSLSGKPRGKRSSWGLVGVMIAAFVAGGLALVLHLWVVFWACVAVVVLSIPAGMAIRIMDDTVGWTLPMTAQSRARYRSVTQAAETHRRERIEENE